MHTFRKLPMSRPNTNARSASITGSPDNVCVRRLKAGGSHDWLPHNPVSCEHPPIGFQGACHHSVYGEPFHDSTTPRIADLSGFFRMVHQPADGSEDGSLVVIDEQPVLTIADDLGQAAYTAGDHGNGSRHGEQGAGAQ